MKQAKPPSAGQWRNPVKEKLARGESVFGAVITVNNVEIAAQTAALGFDFLWLEMEHAPLTLETVRNIVLATRGLQAIPFARPPVNRLWTAKQVLDAGVLGVMFPFTSSPELARQAVAACRYPTAGLRGSGADLARFRWTEPDSYYDFADQNVLVVTIIEDALGLENADAIAATPGVDVVFIGTSDLSFALGLRGEPDHPRLRKAVAHIAAAAQRHGKVLGRPAGTLKQVRQFEAQGFRFFHTRTEVEFMAAGARLLLDPLGKPPQFGALSAPGAV